MKFDIRNRWNNSVMFEVEADSFVKAVEKQIAERADLRRADLCGANLRGADLRGANLRGADLRGADLDYSCWPLWCGSLFPKIDKRLACQLLYHAMMAMQWCDDSEVKEFLANKQAIALANQCHRADDCGKI